MTLKTKAFPKEYKEDLNNCYKNIIEIKTKDGVILEHWSPITNKAYLFIGDNFVDVFNSSSECYKFLAKNFSNDFNSIEILDNIKGLEEMIDFLDGCLMHISMAVCKKEEFYYVEKNMNKCNTKYFKFSSLNDARAFVLNELAQYLDDLEERTAKPVLG